MCTRKHTNQPIKRNEQIKVAKKLNDPNQCFPTFFDLVPKVAPRLWVITSSPQITRQ